MTAGDNAMQKITPFLWFDDQAEEAMHHYVSIFENSKVLGITRYGDAGPGPKRGWTVHAVLPRSGSTS